MDVLKMHFNVICLIPWSEKKYFLYIKKISWAVTILQVFSIHHVGFGEISFVYLVGSWVSGEEARSEVCLWNYFATPSPATEHLSDVLVNFWSYFLALSYYTCKPGSNILCLFFFRGVCRFGGLSLYYSVSGPPFSGPSF